VKLNSICKPVLFLRSSDGVEVVIKTTSWFKRATRTTCLLFLIQEQQHGFLIRWP